MVGINIEENMEKSYKIITLLLLCLFTASVSAQNGKEEMVTISATMYDELRANIKALTDSTKSLTDSCASLNAVILDLQKKNGKLSDAIGNSRHDMKGKVAIIGRKDSLITILRQQHKTDSLSLSARNKEISEMQKQVDETSAKYANGRLYFKYDEKRINNCIDDFSKIKTSSVREQFKQLPDLLQNYGEYSAQLRELLESAQSDPDRKVKNKGDEYKARYRKEIKSLSYYSYYYARQNSGTWSIPYLDNIIKVALSIIAQHDPGHYDPANFISLIEML